jgi:phosphoglycerol transferase MdoB-like AlkP superfamily enzyme
MPGLRFFIPSKKLVVWMTLFAVGLIFFAFFRALFLLAHWPIPDDPNFIEIVKCFFIGLRFDSAVLAILFLPLIIISIVPYIKFELPAARKICAIFLTAVFALFFLIAAADIRFFDVYGNRMNFWAIEYIKYPSLFFYSAVSDAGFWILFSLWIATVAAFYIIILNLIRRLSKINALSRLLPNIIYHVVIIALLALAARGGLGMKPLDWGAAIYSDNHLLNQAALNGAYTLAHSIYEEQEEGRGISSDEDNRFSFYDLPSAYKTVADMLNLQAAFDSNTIDLRRDVSDRSRFSFPPNIIIVIMESWSADKIGSLGAGYNITPCFDSLCREGILFNNFYANGIRTNHGIPAVLCSFPYVSGRSIMRRYSAAYPFRSLADILAEKGYANIFAYGGDIEFDNIQGFLRSVGYRKFYEEKDFDVSKKLGKWGAPDHVVFEKLITEAAGFPRPFHLAVLTLSNHDPHLIPDERFRLYPDAVPKANILNAFYYSDWALGRFIAGIKKYPVFDSTIFIFTADHCPYQYGQYPLMPVNFHIPLLIYSPTLLGDGGGIIDAVGSQVDIIPTIMGLIGFDRREYSWGRDLLNLADNDGGFAVIVSDEKLGYIQDSLFFFEWLNKDIRALYNLNSPDYFKSNIIDFFPDIGYAMRRRLESYIQLGNYLSRGDRKN